MRFGTGRAHGKICHGVPVANGESDRKVCRRRGEINQMTRESAKHSARVRREYLRKKGVAYIAAALGGGVALIAFVIVLGLVVGIGLSFTVWRGYMLAPFLMVLPVFLGLAVLFFRLYRFQSHKAASIPFVPPVVEKLKTLPADEVLLRGAEQPAVPPDELLRAATVGGTTPGVELLRAADSENEETVRRVGGETG